MARGLFDLLRGHHPEAEGDIVDKAKPADTPPDTVGPGDAPGGADESPVIKSQDGAPGDTSGTAGDDREVIPPEKTAPGDTSGTADEPPAADSGKKK